MPLSGKAFVSDSLLTELNQELARRPQYDRQYWEHITKLTTDFYAHRPVDATKFQLGQRVYEAYSAFKHDSAFAYSQHLMRIAQQLNNREKLVAAKLKLINTQLSAGLFKETFDILAPIRSRDLTVAERLEFYALNVRAYNELGSYNQDEVYQPIYRVKARAYTDSMLQISPAGSYESLTAQLYLAKQANDLPTGSTVYRQLRQLPNLTLHQLAISATNTATLYQSVGQEDKAFELLLVAAIADIKSSTKETAALALVANYSYQKGDLTNAYAFIKAAQEDAAFYNARQRQLQNNKFAAVIDGRKVDIIENQRKSLKTYALLATGLAGLVAAFAFVIFTQLSKLRKASRLIAATVQELRDRNSVQQQLNLELNQSNSNLAAANAKLVEDNKIKEEYIGYYFHYNTHYLNEREALKKKLATLLETKQLAGIQRLIDGINVKRERGELFKDFDASFLRLFPDFIKQFNTLFKEEDRAQPDEGQLLTAELRIFALIRLGIQDSEQISRMLGYSINTIYVYKTRVKNRAIVPKEEFEARIQAIQAF
ncbi:DUF6377 domain-containing protein [Hymenobacter glacieicola]|uniref:Transcriptional regulator n=1 Tax=Hymenobacter glacieicola TaxID=1562124 RepID=A0ABQ1WK25_9BACT|nr:DUF6377 domain-containing protein [Hymenobacter glacieicola]GGG33827.1 transcriptional regulator [Hymenobacter glacieicola]